jgi:hypothetical protein
MLDIEHELRRDLEDFDAFIVQYNEMIRGKLSDGTPEREIPKAR